MKKFFVLLLVVALVSSVLAPASLYARDPAPCEAAAWAHGMNMGMNIACVWSIIYDLFGSDWPSSLGDADDVGGRK